MILADFNGVQKAFQKFASQQSVDLRRVTCRVKETKTAKSSYLSNPLQIEMEIRFELKSFRTVLFQKKVPKFYLLLD